MKGVNEQLSLEGEEGIWNEPLSVTDFFSKVYIRIEVSGKTSNVSNCRKFAR